MKKSLLNKYSVFDTFCEKYDLIPLEVDHCVDRGKLDDLTLLGIFVEDGFICSDHLDKLEAILHQVDTKFKVSQGGGDYYVDFEVICCKEARFMFFTKPNILTKCYNSFICSIATMFQHLLTFMFICLYNQMILNAISQFQFHIKK